MHEYLDNPSKLYGLSLCPLRPDCRRFDCAVFLSAGRYAGAETILIHRGRAIPRRFRRNGCRNSGQRQQQYGHRHARDHHQRHFAFISKRCDEYPRRRGTRHDFRRCACVWLSGAECFFKVCESFGRRLFHAFRFDVYPDAQSR